MAVKIENPKTSVNKALRLFADDLLRALMGNMVTQHVWPVEVYPGYAKINQERKRLGRWHSTGSGFTSFETSVLPTPGNEGIAIRFNDYLRYVDMGVGKGTRWSDVQADKKARYKNRYVSFWNRADGQSHRPAIMMEMRHLEQRLIRYFADFYGREIETSIIRTMEGISPFEIKL